MQIAASFQPTYAARCPEPASATIQRQTVQIPDTRAPDTTSKTVRSGNNVKILSCCFSDSRSLKSGKSIKQRDHDQQQKVRHRYPINLFIRHILLQKHPESKQDDRKNQIFMQCRGMLRAVLKYTQESFPKRHRGRYHFLPMADIAAGFEQNLADQSPVHQYIGG